MLYLIPTHFYWIRALSWPVPAGLSGIHMSADCCESHLGSMLAFADAKKTKPLAGTGGKGPDSGYEIQMVAGVRNHRKPYYYSHRDFCWV